jgi:hypothetical protein
MFSLVFEAQISDPTPQNEQQLFRDCVEQAVLAEEVGFDGSGRSSTTPCASTPT